MWRKEIARKTATKYPIAPLYADGTHRHLDSRALASIVAQVEYASPRSEYAVARKKCKAMERRQNQGFTPTGLSCRAVRARSSYHVSVL
jgi:hypothetical protein